LAELGLEDLVLEDAYTDGEDDDDFDEVTLQEGKDLAATVQLPGVSASASEGADA
jgi:hypothetical protein